MKSHTVTLVPILAALAVGCGESVPVNDPAPKGTNPYVSGDPESRIKRVQEDATLSEEEKARRIKVIKERNNIP